MSVLECRACKKKIPAENRFCKYCGWSNGAVRFTQAPIYFIKPSASREKLNAGIRVVYEGAFPVKARCEIKDNACIRFGNNKQEEEFEFAAGKDNEINFIFEFDSEKNRGEKERFVLEISSTDSLPAQSGCLRPYKKETEYLPKDPVHFEIFLKDPVEPEISREIVVFNKLNRDEPESLKILNEGELDIEITDIECAEDTAPIYSFEIQGARKLSKGEECAIEIKFIGNLMLKDEPSEAKVKYTVGGKPYAKNFYIYISEQEAEGGELSYHNIIAIDFGTSKTAVAYLSFYESEDNRKIEDLNFAKGEFDAKITSIPSSIGYDYTNDDQVLIGNDVDKDYIYYTDRIKTQLRNDNITFFSNKRGTTSKPTNEVVEDFFKTLRDNYLEKLLITPKGTPARNKYIFTLPVLDGGEAQNQEDYQRQREVTCAGAKAVFKNKYLQDNHIDTILESEAAMFSIFDIIQTNERGWKGIELEDGDVICVYDYGAGTLDISFGEYYLGDNGKPGIRNIDNIGKYMRNDKSVTLGGDDIDNSMFVKFITDNIENEKLKFDYKLVSKKNGDDILVSDINDNNVLLIGEDDNISFVDEQGEALRISKGNDLYTDMPLSELRNSIRDTKEQISKGYFKENGGEPEERVRPATGSIIYSSESLNFSKNDYARIIEENVTAAIKEIRKMIKKHKKIGDNLKYMFLVGGSSLSIKVKELLSKEPELKRIKILSPYDYARQGDERIITDDVHDAVKDTAVHAIARGAVLSYLVKFDDMLSFGIKIESEGTNIENVLDLPKHTSIPWNTGEFFINGGRTKEYTFRIFADIGPPENKEKYLLGRAVIKAEDLGSEINMPGIYIRASISKSRTMQIQYTTERDCSDEDYLSANEFDIIV